MSQPPASSSSAPSEPETGTGTGNGTDWERTDAALDALLAMPVGERTAAIPQLAAGDVDFEAELRLLAAGLEAPHAWLDRPASDALFSAAAPPDRAPSLRPGTRLGAWRVQDLLGRGGMGEVYRAQRADGQYEQAAAIKLMRADMAPRSARFQAERQIVARLTHPGIAQLLDGGVADDGRAYMAMELVTGRPITAWCTENGATLVQRLALFVEVCDAVAYAHRNLVVHRDLKPANVFVNAEGRVKLLDFGVARLLDDPSGETTRELLLTPAYASPEQLGGGAITTAADVYALGLLLHELLCGQPAFAVQSLPLAAAMQRVLTQPPEAPSQAADKQTQPPVSARQLSGDLDAIVAKALRKEPEQRYASVDALRADVQRHLRHEPVHARRGSWAYAAGRALRRYRTTAAAGGVVLLALGVGVFAVAWQAAVARDEAARATAVKNFLMQVFRASDPRMASDKPRGQATARELLDAGAGRIEREFKDQPGLEIELLGTVAALYRELGEGARYSEIQARRVALASRFPGRYPQPEIESLLNDAADAQSNLDRAKARAHLAKADALITRAGLDASALRARWWIGYGQTADPGQQTERTQAFDRATALFERDAPRNAGKVTALTERALVNYDFGDYAGAVRGNRQALAARQDVDNPDDGEAQTIWGNLGQAYVHLGQYDDARAAFKEAASLARQTYGERHPNYWEPAASYARMLHLSGRRDEAMAQFDALLQLIPKPPTSPDAREATNSYALCLVAQGEAERALPLFEALREGVAPMTTTPAGDRYLALELGASYELLGRHGEARRALQSGFESFVASEPADRQTRMKATERWARFLVGHGDGRGDLDTAERLFSAVMAQDHDRHFAHTALAQAGLARVALERGQASAALSASTAAMQRWAEVRGFRDVRMGVDITRVHARALLARGDAAGARAAAAQALADSERYDAPGAASITEARALLKQAGLAKAP